jgi:hypothetical protein
MEMAVRVAIAACSAAIRWNGFPAELTADDFEIADFVA